MSVSSNTVAIQWHDAESGQQHRGSGAVIGYGRILTCRHVVPKDVKHPIQLSFPQLGSTLVYEARVSWISTDHDLAIVSTIDPSWPDEALVLTQYDGPIERGQRWRSYGYPKLLPSGLPIEDGLIDDTNYDAGAVAGTLDPTDTGAMLGPPSSTVLLKCSEAKGHLEGFSGAPIIIDGRLAAIMSCQSVGPDGQPVFERAIGILLSTGLSWFQDMDLLHKCTIRREFSRTYPVKLVRPFVAAKTNKQSNLYYVIISLTSGTLAELSELIHHKLEACEVDPTSIAVWGLEGKHELLVRFRTSRTFTMNSLREELTKGPGHKVFKVAEALNVTSEYAPPKPLCASAFTEGYRPLQGEGKYDEQGVLKAFILLKIMSEDESAKNDFQERLFEIMRPQADLIERVAVADVNGGFRRVLFECVIPCDELRRRNQITRDLDELIQPEQIAKTTYSGYRYFECQAVDNADAATDNGR